MPKYVGVVTLIPLEIRNYKQNKTTQAFSSKPRFRIKIKANNADSDVSKKHTKAQTSLNKRAPPAWHEECIIHVDANAASTIRVQLVEEFPLMKKLRGIALLLVSDLRRNTYQNNWYDLMSAKYGKIGELHMIAFYSGDDVKEKEPPAGWIKRVDQHHRKYYINVQTGATAMNVKCIPDQTESIPSESNLSTVTQSTYQVEPIRVNETKTSYVPVTRQYPQQPPQPYVQQTQQQQQQILPYVQPQQQQLQLQQQTPQPYYQQSQQQPIIQQPPSPQNLIVPSNYQYENYPSPTSQSLTIYQQQQQQPTTPYLMPSNPQQPQFNSPPPPLPPKPTSARLPDPSLYKYVRDRH